MLKTWYSLIWKLGGQGRKEGRKERINFASVVISRFFPCTIYSVNVCYNLL